MENEMWRLVLRVASIHMLNAGTTHAQIVEAQSGKAKGITNGHAGRHSRLGQMRAQAEFHGAYTLTGRTDDTMI